MGIKVFAPASIGNIGVGFDVMGMAIEKPGDEVVVLKKDEPGVVITAITGAGGKKLPLDPNKNTAGVAVQALLAHLDMQSQGISMEIHKKMPSGSGLGSSSASACAAVYAASELLRLGLSKRELLPFACQGEAVASGSFHADNVAPCLLGGIIFIRDNDTLDVHRLHAPKGLYVAVVHPHFELLTKTAREILKPEVPLKSMIRQTANLAGFMAGMYTGDIALIGRSLEDVVIEPQRAALIPGFYAVKDAAMQAGALGCSISGAGPSVFALCHNSLIAENAAQGMQKAFTAAGLESTIYISGINTEGAVIC